MSTYKIPESIFRKCPHCGNEKILNIGSIISRENNEIIKKYKCWECGRIIQFKGKLFNDSKNSVD
jgi:DNA-directed RNA polymerase subunit RPC12/RpoP